MERIGEDGNLDLSEERPARDISQGYTAILDGDLVIAKITPCFENGKGALCQGLHGGIAFGTTELIVLRAKSHSDSRYLYWPTRGHHFRNWGEAEMRGSAGQKRVTEEFVSNYRSAELKPAEQRRIAGYLDEATGKIDRLLGLRRRQMELLQEQRAALIQQAVTRGLNPNAPLKPSGLQWLGDVPEHWAIPPLYARYNQVLGKMLDQGKMTGEHPTPYLRNLDVRWDYINVEDLPVMDIAPHERGRFTVKKGDLLMVEGRELGRCAIWRGDDGVIGFQKALHRLRPLNLRTRMR